MVRVFLGGGFLGKFSYFFFLVNRWSVSVSGGIVNPFHLSFQDGYPV